MIYYPHTLENDFYPDTVPFWGTFQLYLRKEIPNPDGILPPNRIYTHIHTCILV